MLRSNLSHGFKMALGVMGAFIFWVLLLWAWISPVSAYESYHDPNLDDQGYCAQCHPGFANGRNDALHALHTGSDPFTTNCNLCHTGSGRDNPLVMWSVGDTLGCTGCHGRDYGETIQGNYRGFNTAGKPKASGYGLRKRHLNSGITICLDCHSDVSQAFIKPENVNPPYYSRADVTVKDACNTDGSEDGTGETLGEDLLGLDNDGDTLVDHFDPDCQAPEAPNIDVVPRSLNFATVTIGETQTRTVTIGNTGGANLTVTALTVSGSTEFFLTNPPPTPLTVAPGGTAELLVSYQPQDVGEDFGSLMILSDDPDEPSVTVSLSGSGVAVAQCDISANPTALNFGEVRVGITKTLSTTIGNSGNAACTVNLLVVTGEDFALTAAPQTPFVVAPGSGVSVPVDFTPSAVAPDAGTLQIGSDDPDEPLITVTLSGSGITGNQAPIADPDGPYTGIVGQPVQMIGSGSTDPDGTIVFYRWNFGDGTISRGINPVHSYAFVGTYTVTLTVIDNEGATGQATTKAFIGATTHPPVADANGPYAGTVGVPVVFDGTGSFDTDGTIMSYAWDFGDGTAGTGAQPTHTYTAAGTYGVRLTVTDNQGATGTDTTTSQISQISPIDVSLKRLSVPGQINLRLAEIKERRIEALVEQDTGPAQEATVDLAADVEGADVTILPPSVTQLIRVGSNKFRFTASFQCRTPGPFCRPMVCHGPCGTE